MKIFFALFLIAALFAVGSKEKPILQPPTSEQQSEVYFNIDTTLVVTPFYLGEHEALDIYVGQKIDPSKHEALALFPNCEELDTAKFKPPVFSRSRGNRTHISSIKLNSNYVKHNSYGKVSTWNFDDRRSPAEYFKDLTYKLITSNPNIVAARFRIVSTNEDRFSLEDVQLIYKQGYEWDDIKLTVEQPNRRAKVVCYNLDNV